MTWERPPGERRSAPAEAFGVLATEARLDILVAFRPDAPTPISYSTIQERTGIEDNGLLNYHLGKLKGHFVTEVDRGYQLLPAGNWALGALVTGMFTDHVHTEKHGIGVDCPDCDGALVAWYRDSEVIVRCPDCDRRFSRGPLPPSAVHAHEFEDVLLAYSLDYHARNVLTLQGVCPFCRGRARNYTTAVDSTEEWTGYEFPAVMECADCGGTRYGNLARRFLTHPAVVSFYYDHAIDVFDRPFWAFRETIEETARAVSEDPLRVEVPFAADDEELRLTVTRDLEIAETDRVPMADG